jgi:hypothetical protein
MDYVFLIAGSIVIITCFYFIVSPFFTNGGELAAGTETGNEKVTLEQVYGAVNELEMDFLMKKITREDFEKLKDQYQMLAAALMKKETASHTARKSSMADEVENEILKELKKLRNRGGNGNGAGISS